MDGLHREVLLMHVEGRDGMAEEGGDEKWRLFRMSSVWVWVASSLSDIYGDRRMPFEIVQLKASSTWSW